MAMPMMERRVVLAGIGVAVLAPTVRAAAPAVSDRFSVVVQGAGPDLILVPGLACSRDVWAGVVAGLGGRYRVHLVQVAGFGGEPARGNAKGDVCAGVAEGLAAYIAQPGLHRPALIGHSMGGTIGLMLAARHPDALGRLMVVDMFPALAVVMTRPGATPQEIKATADGIGGNMEHADAAQFKTSLDQSLNGMILTASARPAVEAQGIASDHGVAGRAMREMILTDLAPELGRITVPVTVVHAWNRNDPYTAEQSDQLYKSVYAKLKGVKLVRIDDSAHFVFLDQPQKFEAAVLDFLKT